MAFSRANVLILIKLLHCLYFKHGFLFGNIVETQHLGSHMDSEGCGCLRDNFFPLTNPVVSLDQNFIDIILFPANQITQFIRIKQLSKRWRVGGDSEDHATFLTNVIGY